MYSQLSLAKKKKHVKMAIYSQLSLAKILSGWLLIVLKYGNYIRIQLFAYYLCWKDDFYAFLIVSVPFPFGV